MEDYTIASQSITGSRDHNEDALLELPLGAGSFCLAVADGMGGPPGGEIASNEVLAAIRQFLLKIDIQTIPVSRLKKIVAECFELAQYTVRQKTMNNASLEGMGTTLTLLLVHNHRYVYGNIGDSRLYVVAADYIRQMTTDHTYIEEFRQKYNEPVSQEFTSRYGHILTRAVNGKLDRPDIFPAGEESLEFNQGEILMLCTDGLILDKSVQSPQFFVDQMRVSPTLEEACHNLVSQAVRHGSTDNITVLLARRNYAKFREITQADLSRGISSPGAQTTAIADSGKPGEAPARVSADPAVPSGEPKAALRVPGVISAAATTPVPDTGISSAAPGQAARGHKTPATDPGRSSDLPAGGPTKPRVPAPGQKTVPNRSGSPSPAPAYSVPGQKEPSPFNRTLPNIPGKVPTVSKTTQQPSTPAYNMPPEPAASSSFPSKTLNIIGLVILIILSTLAILSIFDINPFEKEEPAGGQRIVFNGKPVTNQEISSENKPINILFAPGRINAMREKYLLQLSRLLVTDIKFQYTKALARDLKNLKPGFVTDILIETWDNLLKDNLVEPQSAPLQTLVQPGLLVSATDSNKFVVIIYALDQEGSTDSIDYVSKSSIQFFTSGLSLMVGKYFNAAYLSQSVGNSLFYLVTYDPGGTISENPLGFNPEMGSFPGPYDAAPCSDPQLVPRFATYRNQPVIDLVCPLPENQGCFRIGLPW